MIISLSLSNFHASSSKQLDEFVTVSPPEKKLFRGCGPPIIVRDDERHVRIVFFASGGEVERELQE